MISLEYEVDRLKDIYFEMLDLVRSQMIHTREALSTGDHDIACDVMRKESRVNAYELTIDRECEDFIALQAPVASDLRMAIAILKMSGNLERIGDHAYRISNFIYDHKMVLSKDLFNTIEISVIFDEIDQMFVGIYEALLNSDVKLAKAVFKRDKLLDKINKKAPKLLQEYLESSNDSVANIILVSRMIGKLERTGDLIKNIAEEIIFYLESKVIKHKKKNKKIRKRFNLPGFSKE